MPISAYPSSVTPLQRIMGMDASEELYDQLDLREQIIVDLMIAGWSQHLIGEVLGLSQGWVSILLRRIRYNLANSKLVSTVEIRQYYRETSPIMPGDPPDRYESEQDN